MRISLSCLAAVGLLTAACAPVEPMPPAGEPSQCKAEQYQRFIGRHYSTLPPQPAGETWRVTCTTCPVTMDYSPSRLNVFYDQSSGIVREVKCG